MGETLSQNAKVIGEKASVVAQVGCRMGSLVAVHDTSSNRDVSHPGSSVHMGATRTRFIRLVRTRRAAARMSFAV